MCSKYDSYVREELDQASYPAVDGTLYSQGVYDGSGYGEGVMDFLETGQGYAEGTVYGLQHRLMQFFYWLQSYVPNVPMLDRRLVLLVVFALLAYGVWMGFNQNKGMLMKQYETIKLQISTVTPDF